MSYIEKKTLYFEEAGPKNTSATLEAVKERANELNIHTIVIATNHGATALKALEILPDTEIIAITICESFQEEGWTMSHEEREKLTSKGIKTLTAPHTLGDGVASSITEKYGGKSIEEIVRETLYRFCQGMKVCVEIVLMAADAGLIPLERDIISVAGTGEGADTAIVVKPSYSRKFCDLAVREIIAKPR